MSDQRSLTHRKQGRCCNTGWRDSTEMNPTGGYTSQRTLIYNSILNTVILSRVWKSLVNVREPQRYCLGARQGLSWEEMALRAIMKFGPFFDSLQGGLSGSHQRRALGHKSQAGPVTAQSHSALGSWCTHHWLLQMAPRSLLQSSNSPWESLIISFEQHLLLIQ